MRELFLKMSVSVDGFVAGANGELDWIFRSTGAASTQWLVDLLGHAGLHAMGRRTYQDMRTYWPTATSPLAHPMNAIPKVVFSRSGTVGAPDREPPSNEAKGDSVDLAAWQGWLCPTVAGTDLVADIQRLKAEGGKPILAHGGAAFASSLIAAHLVDVFYLIVHPTVLGRGLPVFAGRERPLHLKLEGLQQFDTGIVVKTYRPCDNA